MKSIFVFYFLLFLSFVSCRLPKTFETENQPPAPDYFLEENWSALPFRSDAADAIPNDETWVNDSLKEVDVFYVYPTLYDKGKTWTADVNNEKLNKRIDKLPVRLQASCFNKTARVYAPRYRQANVDSYKEELREMGKEVLAFAYTDVKRAFEYYLENYNDSRPIIIASHSQGTSHTLKLLEEYFDQPDMKERLVCAYIVGMAVDTTKFELLRPCSEPNETNCYVTWSSYRKGYELKPEKDFSEVLVGNIVVNPVSWNLDTTTHISEGGILLNLSREKLFTTTARIHDTYLWVNTNTILFQRKKEPHLLDYNMFWHDIRKNVSLRSEAFLLGE